MRRSPNKSRAAAVRMMNQLKLNAHKASLLVRNIDKQLRNEAYKPLSQRKNTLLVNSLRANRNRAKAISNAAMQQLNALQAGRKWVNGPFTYNARSNNVRWNAATNKTLKQVRSRTHMVARATNTNKWLWHVQPGKEYSSNVAWLQKIRAMK